MLINTIRSIFQHPLNRNVKHLALIRFLRWQVGSRLLAEPVVFSWIGGAKLIVKTSDHGLTRNIYCGLQDYHEMSFLLHFLRKDDVFFDVGANFGCYSILAAVVRRCLTYAFEPVDTSFNRLRQNFLVNEVLQQNKLLNLGLGAKSQNLRFTIGKNCTNHVVPRDSCETNFEYKDVKTLDCFTSQHCPSLIKIDVEGYEYEVLKGSLKTMQNSELKAIIIELNGSGERYGKTDEQIIELLVSNGFVEYVYEPMSRLLSCVVGKSENRLFLRDFPFVEERLKNSDPFEVNGWKI